MMRPLRTLSAFLLSAALLAGCDPGAAPSSNVRGRTSDELGAQKQGLGGNALGGSGSASATTKVQVAVIKDDGSLEVVGSSEVKADGSYDVNITSVGKKKLIAQAVDASGEVRESVIVEASGAEDETVTASPMNTESSVEAEVLQQLVVSGGSVAEANAIDLRARINAKTAESVKASTDAASRIKALAEAVAASQRAQLKAYAEAGVTTSQSALFDAQLEAAVKLNAALHAAPDKASAEAAYEAFITELQAKTRAKAGDAKKASRGERAASVAFRATIKARLQVSGQALDPVADAAVRQAAALEARTVTEASEAALASGSAAQAQVDALKAAGTTLRASLASSTSISATVQAYAAYHASIVGSAGVTGSILGNYLEVNGATAASVQPAIGASATAAATLDTQLNTAVTAAVQTTGAINFDTLATGIVAALKTFDTTVQAQSVNLAGFGSKADVAIELMAQANGSLRIAE